MKSAALFIHSRYPQAHINFYQKLCRGKFKIAVDGGYNFFKKSKIKPDLIIGDFDSLKKSSVKGLKTLSYPRRKEATDTELAVSYCIENKFDFIDIIVPSVGEPDHFLGLVTLLQMPELNRHKKAKFSARIVNHQCEIMLLIDRDILFTDCVGEKISVVPFGDSFRLSCAGMEYAARDLSVKSWQSRGMRNLIRDNRAKVSVKGSALVIHYWNKNS